MAKRRRRRGRGDRIESLADLTPENLAASTADGGAEDAAGFDERSDRIPPVSAQEQAAWDKRVAQAEQEKTGRGTMAPLVVAGVAVLGVVGLIVWSTLSSSDPVTVATMPTPVIAADGAGSAVYPANSLEAVRENVRFGFAPAVDLVELGDGTVVLGEGGEGAGVDVFGKPYAQLTQETFANGEIPAPRADTDAGTPVTWEDAYGTYADDTIFMPAVDTQNELDAVLSAAKDADRMDALIIRTADDAIAGRASNRDVPVLYAGETDATSPEELLRAGYQSTVVSQDSEDWDSWTDSDLDVWVTGATTPDAYDEAVASGARGAVVADPFAITGERQE